MTIPLKFELGKVLTTAQVNEKVSLPDILEVIAKHSRGDWGIVSPEDAALNEEALTYGNRLLSAYDLDDVGKLWVITEADRSSTTVLFPDEY